MSVAEVAHGLAAAAEPFEPEQPAPLAAIPEYPMAALPPSLWELAVASGLPEALVAGAGLAALAAAVGAQSELEVQPGWRERAILWIPLIAPRGAGKSPAQSLAFGPIRTYDVQVAAPYRADVAAWRSTKCVGEKPSDPTILAGDMTVEALARRLDDSPAVALDVDELSQLLRGLGEYKHGPSGDRGRLLALWSGAPWRFTRVGSGGGGANGVDIYVPRPTVAICGGLQPALHALLGGDADGLRPRWLPHLAAMPRAALSDEPPPVPLAWHRLLGAQLLPLRSQRRTWTLGPAARAAFFAHQRRWKQLATGAENGSVSAAAIKADVHLARVALCLAEAEHPAQGGEICPDLIDRAAEIIDFTLDCWRALPDGEPLALSFRDAKLGPAVDRLVEWLDQHGGQATRRDLLHAGVAGVRTAGDLDALLGRFDAQFPGAVRTEAPAHAGRPAVVVHSPRRPTEFVRTNKLFDAHSPGSDPSFELKSSPKQAPGEFGRVPNKFRESEQIPNKLPDADLPDDIEPPPGPPAHAGRPGVVVYSPRVSPEFVAGDKLPESHNPISEADFELKSGPKGGSEDFVASGDKFQGGDKPADKLPGLPPLGEGLPDDIEPPPGPPVPPPKPRPPAVDALQLLRDELNL